MHQDDTTTVTAAAAAAAAAVSDSNNNDIMAVAANNGGSKLGSWWARHHHRWNEAADNLFYRLGYWVAKHTRLTLLISAMLVGACCIGFVNFEIESDGEDLWVPSDSLSKQQEKAVLSYFNDTSSYAVILMDSPSDGGNILTKEAMDTLWELHSLVLEIETDGKTYSDICLKQTDGTCEFSSRAVTRFWGDSFETYNASVTSDADVLADINVDTYPDGASVNLEAVFGNTIEYDSSDSVTGAEAMVQTYALDTTTDDADEEANEWMTDYQDFMKEQAEEYNSIFGIEYITGRSIDDALNESISGEIFLFVATCALLVRGLVTSKGIVCPDLIMLVVVMIAIGRFHAKDNVRRRSWLGNAGLYVVMAAGLAAYGLNSGFGVPFTTLASILPFILIGIGVDDMFVIVASFDHTDPALPVEERVALGLKRCGVSITYTSLTNFFAFILGSTTSLPAVEYFCLYAGMAILFDFFLQVTAFVALLTLDAKRQEAGRYNCFCCFTSESFLQKQEKISINSLRSPLSHRERNLRFPPVRCSPSMPRYATTIGRFLKEKYTPFILSIPGKTIILLGTAALLAAGIYGVTQATEDFEVLDLAPDDHYARDYTTLAREYDLEITSQFVPLGVYTLEVDYTNIAVQAQMQETDELMEEQQHVSGPLDSWLSSFIAWAANDTKYSANVTTSGRYDVYNNPNTFYAAVAEFIEEEDNERFQDNIIFKSDGSIEISRSLLFLVDMVDTEENVRALEDTRDVIDQSTLDPEPFGFSGVFVFTEQFLVIYDELIENFILALVAVAVLSLLILGNVGVVVLVCVSVVIVDIDLLGFVYHWGLDINSITVIELIMAVGLVVDYMVHIVHFFLHQASFTIPKDARIADALGEIGPSVMIGAATTFLGIMPLAFANNVIFRVFFKMFLVIISFGFFHGVAFIPVVLSLMPDWCVRQSRGSADTREIKASPLQETPATNTVLV
ncbi:unnamed protein product [Ascophyllum nodosum]